MSGALAALLGRGGTPVTGPASPYFVAVGNMASGTGAITVQPPMSYANDDLLVLLVTSANQAITTPAGGWTQFANSPQFTGTAAAAGGVRLAAFYKTASGAQSAVSVADSGNFTAGVMLSVRRQDLTSPVDTTAGSVKSSATGTTFTLPAVTTAYVNDLILLLVGQDRDAANYSNLSGWTNANLTGITERFDQVVLDGAGGGIGVATADRAAVGSTGTTSVTSAVATTAAFLTVALRGSSVYNDTTRCLGPAGALQAASTGLAFFGDTLTLTLTLNTDGTLTVTTTTAGALNPPTVVNTLISDKWLNKAISGGGSGFYCRISIISVTGGVSGDTGGAWVQMTSARDIIATASNLLTQAAGTVVFEWSTGSAGTPIVAMSSIYIDAAVYA